MPFSATALDTQLNALAGGTFSSIIGYASLHAAFSATGGNELTGGSPAYARQALTWGSASAGSMSTASVAGTFAVPASGTVAYVGLWSAAGTAATFAGMGPNGGAAPCGFTSTAASPVVFTAPGSSYGNNDTVALFASPGGSVSSDFTIGDIYYVVNASGATFQLASSSGGTGINSSHAGAGLVQGVTVETYGSQGTFKLTSETLSQF